MSFVSTQAGGPCSRSPSSGTVTLSYLLQIRQMNKLVNRLDIPPSQYHTFKVPLAPKSGSDSKPTSGTFICMWLCSPRDLRILKKAVCGSRTACPVLGTSFQVEGIEEGLALPDFSKTHSLHTTNEELGEESGSHGET